MKENSLTKTGKVINFPARMFKHKELDEMQIESVDNAVFFNVTKFGMPLPEVSDAVKNNMRLLNYVDCSSQTFSTKRLVSVVKQEIDAGGDFISIPCFKDETEHDITTKIQLAWNLKAQYSKDIIFVVSHKADDVVMQKIINNYNGFDHLAIFYGCHYCRFVTLSGIQEKILNFKVQTGKRVFCFGMPLMFAWDNSKRSESFLFPVCPLISDGWVKNWKKGGGKDRITLIDFKDLKNKDELGWYRTGHATDEVVKYVGITVKSLFEDRPSMEGLRQNYKRMLTDEIMQDVMSLNSSNIEQYVSSRFSPLYYNIVISLYKEKILQANVINAEWLNKFSEDDRRLLIAELRKYPSIGQLEVLIAEVKIVAELENTTINDIVLVIQNF